MELLAIVFLWNGVQLVVIAMQQTAVSSGDHFVGGPQWTENHPCESGVAFVEEHSEQEEGLRQWRSLRW